MNDLTQQQKDFTDKYHFKIIKPLGKHYQNIPIKEYIVTSALFNYEDDNKTTIFAIKALDYNLENKHWITFHIDTKEFDKAITDFEIIRDGYEDYVKPKIISESLATYVGEDGGDWLIYFSDYYKDGQFITGKPQTEYIRIPKEQCPKDAYIGLEEYAFIYKSILDLDKPSRYIIKMPAGLNYTSEVFEYVASFRRDVLDNKVAYGINYNRLFK